MRGIHRSPVNSPHPGQWRGAFLYVLFDLPWTNAWVNNRDAGDLRRHRAHYYVTVMWLTYNCHIGLSQWYRTVDINSIRKRQCCSTLVYATVFSYGIWNKNINTISMIRKVMHHGPFVMKVQGSSGVSPHRNSVMQSFDILFLVSLNKLLKKLSICWWFETRCCSCDVTVMRSLKKRLPCPPTRSRYWVSSVTIQGIIDVLILLITMTS